MCPGRNSSIRGLRTIEEDHRGYGRGTVHKSDRSDTALVSGTATRICGSSGWVPWSVCIMPACRLWHASFRTCDDIRRMSGRSRRHQAHHLHGRPLRRDASRRPVRIWCHLSDPASSASEVYPRRTASDDLSDAFDHVNAMLGRATLMWTQTTRRRCRM